ncbi:MAG: hypothetical protein GXP45_04165 [bacterium]|nr:hypothetical protein [bacterium]
MSLLAVSIILLSMNSCQKPTADNTRADIIKARYYGNKVLQYLGEHHEYVVVPLFAVKPTVSDSSVAFKRYYVIFRNDKTFSEFSEIAMDSRNSPNASTIEIAPTMYKIFYTPVSGVQDEITILKVFSPDTYEYGTRAVRGVSGKGSGYYRTKMIDKNGRIKYVCTKDRYPSMKNYYIYSSNSIKYNGNIYIAKKIE